MSHITTEDPATLRLPFKEKLSYGIGDLASNILLDIGTLYLLKFYTDVLGLPGTYGGIIFLISKFFTAFTDMGTGIMLDSRRKIGPKGKFRPFILYASFPVTLLAIANFVGTPFDVTGKTVMATILFMLYGLFFSMMNCSYGAMVPAITKNPNERASLAAWRQGGATLGLLLCTVGFVPVMNLIEGNQQLGYIFAATLFSLFGMLAAFGIGNMTQINSIVTSISGTINSFTPINVNAANLIIGIIVAAFCALVLLGGLKRIGQVTEKLVPFMAVIYIVSALIIFFAHIGNIGNVLRGIFVGAFTPSAVVGGIAGVTISAAIKRGVGRGVFSNEAGLGSAPIAHAAADNDSAVHQGCFGVFEVFADTIVICTLTAFAVLMSGTPIEYGQAAGAPLTIAAFSTTFGRAGGVIISVGLTLFATSTILSWCLYGTRCAEFLFKSTKVIKPYQIIFCLVIILGAVTELSLVWDIADTLNGLMAIPNLVGLLGLSPIVIKLTREYFNGVRLGESNRK